VKPVGRKSEIVYLGVTRPTYRRVDKAIYNNNMGSSLKLRTLPTMVIKNKELCITKQLLLIHVHVYAGVSETPQH
jgi:hypothetical protein